MSAPVGAKDAVDVDTPAASPVRSPLRYFSLVFVLSAPFWLVGAATEGRLSADLPIGAPHAHVGDSSGDPGPPGGGMRGVTRLLRKVSRLEADHEQGLVRPRLPSPYPGIYAGVTYGVMPAGVGGSDGTLPASACAGGVARLLRRWPRRGTGWSGYALDPLQDRWIAFRAALVLGVVWAVWHGAVGPGRPVRRLDREADPSAPWGFE